MGATAHRIPWRRSLAGVLAGCVLACGGEPEPATGGGTAAAPAAPAAAERAPAAAPLAAPVGPEDMYVWDATAGPAPDLQADSAECQSQITGQGLASMAQHIECMQDKGWKTHRPGGP